MLVRQILAGKGHNIVTIEPSARIGDVAALISDKRIGAVVVLENGDQLVGIISERDITRGLAAHGNDLIAMKADTIMTKEVVTCAPDEGIDKLMRKMTAGRFRHLPVIEDGKMIGIISIGDVVKNRLEELESQASQLQDYIAGAA